MKNTANPDESGKKKKIVKFRKFRNEKLTKIHKEKKAKAHVKPVLMKVIDNEID